MKFEAVTGICKAVNRELIKGESEKVGTCSSKISAWKVPSLVVNVAIGFGIAPLRTCRKFCEFNRRSDGLFKFEILHKFCENMI